MRGAMLIAATQRRSTEYLSLLSHRILPIDIELASSGSVSLRLSSLGTLSYCCLSNYLPITKWRLWE